MSNDFSKFKEDFKSYDEDLSYEDLPSKEASFDGSELELTDTGNVEEIVHEMNTIPKKLFTYGILYAAQEKVLQKLEDEYSVWYNRKYQEISGGGSKMTEKAKESLIMTSYNTEWEYYKKALREESYKVSLLKNVMRSLDNYSYKLHSILSLRENAMMRGM